MSWLLSVYFLQISTKGNLEKRTKLHIARKLNFYAVKYAELLHSY
jgi:hypothetical protein